MTWHPYYDARSTAISSNDNRFDVDVVAATNRIRIALYTGLVKLEYIFLGYEFITTSREGKLFFMIIDLVRLC